ncbi:MAG TPA: ATP-binding protein [Myxococcota bacterium]|nr:ATP-binding protein [Myxococcota bacterium]HRY94807.1 ATP-binding protein [Myxococcota bacterium]HSA23695.1 ATP-binding protein [Myxococcota bacterium]
MKSSKASPRRAVRGSVVGASEAFQELVHQFTDPFAFLRELIQNSLDAASTRIEVRFLYRGTGADPSAGLGTIEVQDNGEGMDERIIDDYLLTLFSSTKEGDRTKIGKFGIGFVSLFALEPELVVVETGRGGEAWRVRFEPDGRFEKARLPEPVEGTTVRLLKCFSRPAFEELRRQGVEAARFWCKFAECDILADGQPIRQEFTLDAPLAVHHQEEGTELWVGFAEHLPGGPDDGDLAPQVGLYNRGLTLLEDTRLPGAAADLAGLSLRIKSRDLEHTLTRDNVRQDEGYDRLLALVRRVVADQLRPRLVDTLERLAREGGGPGASGLTPEAAYRYARLPCMQLARFLRDEPVLPVLQGAPLSPRALGRLEGPDGALLLAAADSRVTQLLHAQGVRVLRDLDGFGPFLAQLSQRPVWRAEQVFCAPAPVELDPAGQALATRVGELLREAGLKVEAVALGRLEGDGSPWAGRVHVRQREAHGLTRPGHDDRPSLLGGARQVVLLRDAPLVASCLALAPGAPELAALLLGAAILLAEGGDGGRVASLAERCLQARGAADGA